MTTKRSHTPDETTTLDELRESLAEGIALYVAEPGQPARKVVIEDLQWDDPPHTRAHAGLVYA